MSDLLWLTDGQMACLGPFFPKSHGKPRVDDRRALSGIIFFVGAMRPLPMARTKRSTTDGSGGSTRASSRR